MIFLIYLISSHQSSYACWFCPPIAPKPAVHCVRSWKKCLTLSDLITSRGCRSMDPIHLGRRSETCASDMSDMSDMLSSDIFRSTAFNGHIEHIVFDCLIFETMARESRGLMAGVNWMTEVIQNPMGSGQKLMQEEDFRHRCAHHHWPKVTLNKCES